MTDEKAVPVQEDADPATPAVDWAALRAQAEKLGISLSELQQKEREKRLRQARKAQVRPPASSSPGPVKPQP